MDGCGKNCTSSGRSVWGLSCTATHTPCHITGMKHQPQENSLNQEHTQILYSPCLFYVPEFNSLQGSLCPFILYFDP